MTEGELQQPFCYSHPLGQNPTGCRQSQKGLETSDYDLRYMDLNPHSAMEAHKVILVGPPFFSSLAYFIGLLYEDKIKRESRKQFWNHIEEKSGAK